MPRKSWWPKGSHHTFEKDIAAFSASRSYIIFSLWIIFPSAHCSAAKASESDNAVAQSDSQPGSREIAVTVLAESLFQMIRNPNKRAGANLSGYLHISIASFWVLLVFGISQSEKYLHALLGYLFWPVRFSSSPHSNEFYWKVKSLLQIRK